MGVDVGENVGDGVGVDVGTSVGLSVGGHNSQHDLAQRIFKSNVMLLPGCSKGSSGQHCSSAE